MKAFFEAYAGQEKLAPMVREIGWSHNLVILERCKDPLEREFYLRMTRKFGWSKNVLIHQIENRSASTYPVHPVHPVHLVHLVHFSHSSHSSHYSHYSHPSHSSPFPPKK